MSTQLDSSRFSLINNTTLKLVRENFNHVIITENYSMSKNTCKDSCDENGKMSPNVWGPKAWDFLHTLTFAYPHKPSKKEQESMLNFFNSLPDILPCKMCANHCRENLSDIPPQVESKESLTKWLVEFHNEVNIQNGKPKYEYENAVKIYGSPSCTH